MLISLDKEIFLLNSLREETKDTIKIKFEELIRRYPNVMQALPVLIATHVQNVKLEIFDGFLDEL